MTRSMILLSVFTALAVFTPAFSLAQQDEDEEGPARRRLEEYRRMKLIEFVELNEEQAIRYFARERELRQNERNLMDQRKAIISRVRELGKGSPAEADIMKEIQALADIANETAQKRKDFAIGLKDILTPKQLARLIAFEDNFSREVRRIIQNLRREGRPHKR